MTWTDLASTYQQQLDSLYPKEEIQQLFLIVFEHLTAKKSIHYSLTKLDSIAQDLADKAIDILEELKSNKPIQHILREAYFYGKVFEVSEQTLIPRLETEELVDMILKDTHQNTELDIIDIGTGSGCIPISLALHLPARYAAVEVAAETMKIAKRNAIKHHVSIEFIQADILEWEFVFQSDSKYDIIVSNPPYITPSEKKDMHANVIQFEPHIALFVEDQAPLLFYDHIADFALVHLKEKGTLYFEINQYLSTETADLLRKKGFNKVEVFKDINGADRMIRAKR